jgi:translation initiation factor IF-1
VQVEGTVIEALPRGLYRIRIERQRAPRQAQDGLSASKAEVLAHAPSGPGRNFIRMIVGDRVRLELTARDVTRGRIVEKL